MPHATIIPPHQLRDKVIEVGLEQAKRCKLSPKETEMLINLTLSYFGFLNDFDLAAHEASQPSQPQQAA